MDHWRVDTPQGQISQYSSVERFDAFLKQIAGVGYEAIETFDFHLGALRDLFGSLEAARAHMQSRGIDRVLSLFHAVMYDARQSTPHVRATHDRMAGYAEFIMKSSAGLGVQNFIVMPAGLYFDVEPVTDDKIRACAELWNRIGQMTLEGYGVKTCCHHEFFCGIRSAEQLRKFYDWTDPRYVFLCLDTAQHVIAGVDPVDLFLQRRDRVRRLPPEGHAPRRHQRRLPPQARRRGDGADHRSLVLRDRHRRRAGRLPGAVRRDEGHRAGRAGWASSTTRPMSAAATTPRARPSRPGPSATC